MKVLLADDDMVIRQGLRVVIEENVPYCEVLKEVSNGKEALDFIKENKVDVIVTDIKMPIINGVELIKEIEKIDKDVKAIVISGFDDYKFVRQALKHGAVDYLLKPLEIDSLIMILEKIKDEMEYDKNLKIQLNSLKENANERIYILKERLLYDLLWDEDEDQIKFDSKLQKIDIQIKGKKLVIAVLGVDKYLKLKRSESQKGFKMRVMLLKKQIESLEGDKFYTIAVIRDELVIAIFIERDRNDNFYDIVKKKLEDLKQITDKNNNHTISIGLSPEYKEIANSKDAFLKAAKAYEEKFYIGANQLIEYMGNGFTYGKNKDLKINKEIKHLIDMTETGSAIEVRKGIKKIINMLKKEKIKPEEFKNLIYEITFNAACNIADMKSVLSESHMNWKEPINLIKNGDFKEDVERYATDLFFKASERIYEIRMGRSKKVVEVAKEYIKKNYAKDINLKTVAKHVYLNPNYLSELFKSDTGKNFIDYLIETRVSESKKILIRPDVKIYEVARMVGYNEPASFNRAFKKVTGISPSQYRQIIS